VPTSRSVPYLGAPRTPRPATPSQIAKSERTGKLAAAEAAGYVRSPAPAEAANDNPVNSFFDDLGDTASQFAGIYSAIRGQPKTPAPKPAAPPKSNTGLFLGIGAGALVIVIVLVLVLRK